MEVAKASMKEILEGKTQYIVPLFQRPYKWDEKRWNDLWEDIISLLERDTHRTHFMGSIVTMRLESAIGSISKYILIDGQQRITTISIILIVLRDIAKENSNNLLADEIHNTFLVNQYGVNQDHYRLMPTHMDREHYHSLINTEKHEQYKISKAYDFFYRKIKNINYDIEDIKNIIIVCLSVVSISLNGDDDPYLIFESLNYKGMSLEQSDLIKNHIFTCINPDEQHKYYETYWLPVENKLGNDLSEFIRHLLMKEGKDINKRDVYYEFKRRVNKDNSIDYLKTIHRFSTYYMCLRDPNYENNIIIRNFLKILKRLEVTTVYPLLLNFYDAYKNNEISTDEFIEVLKTIDNYIIRRFICNIDTNRLKSAFKNVYNEIKQDYKDNVVYGLKQVLKDRGYPNDIKFNKNFLQRDLYGKGIKQEKTKVILEYIEKSFNKNEKIDISNFEIEHIMPQTLTEEWQNELGDNWEETYQTYLHTIGNLTLTAKRDNQSLSNAVYQIKKDILSKSKLELNKYFNRIDRWGKQEIENRAKYLYQIALNIWPYFGDFNSNQEDDDDDVTGKIPVKLIISNKEFDVTSWRDILQVTLNDIIDRYPEKFNWIVNNFPRYVNKNNSKFRVIRKLKNDYFIEVNLSSLSIRNLCLKIIDHVGIPRSEWTYLYTE